MIIDKETTDQTTISLSIDFPQLDILFSLLYSLPCDLIQVGYRDALGNDRSDFDNEIFKTNLDINGNAIGKTDKSRVILVLCLSVQVEATVPTKEEVLGEKTEDTKSCCQLSLD